PPQGAVKEWFIFMQIPLHWASFTQRTVSCAYEGISGLGRPSILAPNQHWRLGSRGQWERRFSLRPTGVDFADLKSRRKQVRFRSDPFFAPQHPTTIAQERP